MKSKDFDDVLDTVGSYGKYQILVSFFIIIPTSFITAVNVNNKIFNVIVPEDYWCHVEGREATNYSSEEWSSLIIPKDSDGNLEKCVYFNTSDISANQALECTAWEHNKLQVEKSIPTQYNWYCEKHHYAYQVLSVSLAGNAVGTFIFPIIADRITGRKLMFFILLMVGIVSSLLTLVITDVYLFMLLYFINGTTFQANYQMPYVIGLELMTPDKRAIASFYSFVAWTLGMCLTAYMAWLLSNWIQLTIFSCVITIPLFGLWWMMPESPRWLLSQDRVMECTNILVKIAKVNGHTNIKRNDLKNELLSLRNDRVKEGQLYKEFFKYKRLVLNCILLMIQAVTVFMAYVSLLLNVKILPNNYYLSFFILSLSELPSNFIGWISGQYLGRKMTGILTYLSSIILCIIIMFIYEDKVALIVMVALLKITVTSGIIILYIMITEIFPTPIRSTGMGLVVVCGMTGSAFSPFIVEYDHNGLFQYWCIIGLCAISFLMAIFLPETLGLSLPQTLPEANNLSSNRPMFKWINHWNQNEYIAVPKSDKPNESFF